MWVMKWDGTNAGGSLQWFQLCGAWSWGWATGLHSSPEVFQVLLFPAFPLKSLPQELLSILCFPSYRIGQKIPPWWLIPTNPAVFFWLVVDTAGAHNQLLLLILFEALLGKFELSWFSTGYLCSLAFYFPRAHKNHSKFFSGFFWNKGLVYFWTQNQFKFTAYANSSANPSNLC